MVVSSQFFVSIFAVSFNFCISEVLLHVKKIFMLAGNNPFFLRVRTEKVILLIFFTNTYRVLTTAAFREIEREREEGRG